MPGRYAGMPAFRKKIFRPKFRLTDFRKGQEVWIRYSYRLNHTGVICSGVGHIDPPSGGRVNKSSAATLLLTGEKVYTKMISWTEN